MAENPGKTRTSYSSEGSGGAAAGVLRAVVVSCVFPRAAGRAKEHKDGPATLPRINSHIRTEAK